MKQKTVVLNKLLLSQLCGVEGDVVFTKVTNNTDEVEIEFLELSQNSGLSELTKVNRRLSPRTVLNSEFKGITVSDSGDLYMKGNLTSINEEDDCVTIRNGESTVWINKDGSIEIKGKEIKFSNNDQSLASGIINTLSERGVNFN